MKFPSQECYMTFFAWPYTVSPSIDKTLDLVTELDLITDFDLYRIPKRMRLTNRGLLLPRYLVLSNLGLAFVFMLTPVSPEHFMCPDFEFRSLIGTSILLKSVQREQRRSKIWLGQVLEDTWAPSVCFQLGRKTQTTCVLAGTKEV